MKLVVFATLLLFALLASSSISPEWKSTGIHPISDSIIRVIFSLQQENLYHLENLFWERSNPKHENYGKYLSREEIANIVAPKNEKESIVTQWLLDNGFKTHQIQNVKTHDALTVFGTIQQFEELLHIKYEIFQHVLVSDKQIYRSRTSYSLPNAMKPHIQLISGVEDFPPLQGKKKPILSSHHFYEGESIQRDTSTPVIHITRVDARSQEPGASVKVEVEIVCPSSSPRCISEVEVRVKSNNPNLVFYTTETRDVSSQCKNNLCVFALDTEFYVPLNISAVARVSQSNEQIVEFYEYPVVVNPHVVPQSLWDLYSMTKNPLVTNPNATQSVVEFEQQYYSQSDLDEFFRLMSLPSAPVTVIGPNYEDQPGGEANLDIQWIMAMAPGAPTFFWSILANSTAEIDHILTWCYQMEAYNGALPLVNSLSYGMTEGNVDKYLGAGYLNRTNVELQKLALQGLTIIIADGDVGANDIGPPPMSQLSCYPSHPDWPSDSPYVTAIGSTFITPLAEPICYIHGGADCLGNPLGEVTTSVDMGMSWTTGGGFSNVEVQPSYQENAVMSYLSNSSGLVPPEGYFNTTGRAYADAVTVGHNLEVVLSGSLVAIDGTSASAPIFGGMVTVLNDARLNAGKSPLGFISPMMYQALEDLPSCWNDVTVGRNRCGSYGWKPVCCEMGFTATVGWDPVSGLGSPNLEQLKQYVLSLP